MPYIQRQELMKDHDDNDSNSTEQHSLSPTLCQPRRSESRISTYSSNSTSSLVISEDGAKPPGDRTASNGSPFFWNFPLDIAERQHKPETGVAAFFTDPWRGWRLIILASCQHILSSTISCVTYICVLYRGKRSHRSNPCICKLSRLL